MNSKFYTLDTENESIEKFGCKKSVEKKSTKNRGFEKNILNSEKKTPKKDLKKVDDYCNFDFRAGRIEKQKEPEKVVEPTKTEKVIEKVVEPAKTENVIKKVVEPAKTEKETLKVVEKKKENSSKIVDERKVEILRSLIERSEKLRQELKRRQEEKAASEKKSEEIPKATKSLDEMEVDDILNIARMGALFDYEKI